MSDFVRLHALNYETFDAVYARLRSGLSGDAETVCLQFDTDVLLTPTLFNCVIGRLYGEFSHELIRRRLRVSGLAPDDLQLLKRVVENSKRYFERRKNESKRKT